MKKLHPLHIVFSLLIVLSLFLSSCATSEDEYSTEEYSTEEPATEEPGAEPFATGAPGEVVYDLGFTPEQNGFSFSNYGDDIPAINLTAAELRRMFGDQVCSRLDGDECTLTPPAEQWMEQINGAMAGGHCEGMAVLSLMMYTEQIPAADFGGSLVNFLFNKIAYNCA